MEKKDTVRPEVRPEVRQFINNTLALMRERLGYLIDSRRDYDRDCGYPVSPTIEDYNRLFEREGLAERIVSCMPTESWVTYPEVYEIADTDTETEFEKLWKEIQKERRVFSMLERADILSGIGSFGIILLGVDDGKPLHEPAEFKKGRRLLYLRTFDETAVSVTAMENDSSNERFGQPTQYNVKLNMGSSGKKFPDLFIHHSRVVHIADNRRMDEVYGVPRLQSTLNRVLDIRKVLSGSAEMFYQGGFQKFALETPPGEEVTMETDVIREEIYKFINGMQRYIALQNMSVKGITPQIVTPEGHIDAQIDFICITLGIPKRIFCGSERGELASSQDKVTWNNRVMARQNKYITPYIIEPFIWRCVEIGILPEPKEIFVEWPDLNSLSEGEKADVAVKRTQALAQYVSGSVEQVVAPFDYFVSILQLPRDEAESILEAAKENLDTILEEEIEEGEGKIVKEVSEENVPEE